MTKSVPQALSDLGQLYAERNALYKDNYKHFGKTMMGLFPNGLSLETEYEFNRFCLFMQVVHKMSRYSHSLKNGGHVDSIDDATVYLQMLQEYDGLTRNQDLKQTLDDNPKPHQTSIDINSYQISRLQLGPEDVLVVKLNGVFTLETMENARREINSRIGPVKMIIIDDLVELSVLERSKLNGN